MQISPYAQTPFVVVAEPVRRPLADDARPIKEARPPETETTVGGRDSKACAPSTMRPSRSFSGCRLYAHIASAARARARYLPHAKREGMEGRAWYVAKGGIEGSVLLDGDVLGLVAH